MQLLESHIKNELIEKSQLVHAVTSYEENKSSLPDPLSFAAIACGASVFEVSLKVPTWAAQVFFFSISDFGLTVKRTRNVLFHVFCSLLTVTNILCRITFVLPYLILSFTDMLR